MSAMLETTTDLLPVRTVCRVHQNSRALVAGSSVISDVYWLSCPATESIALLLPAAVARCVLIFDSINFLIVLVVGPKINSKFKFQFQLSVSISITIKFQLAEKFQFQLRFQLTECTNFSYEVQLFLSKYHCCTLSYFGSMYLNESGTSLVNGCLHGQATRYLVNYCMPVSDVPTRQHLCSASSHLHVTLRYQVLLLFSVIWRLSSLTFVIPAVNLLFTLYWLLYCQADAVRCRPGTKHLWWWWWSTQHLQPLGFFCGWHGGL